MNPLRQHPRLYEINAWAWLEELSQRAARRITLADVPDADWDAIAQLGFDIVWLMGVWERSPESRNESRRDARLLESFRRALPSFTMDDVVGSPYAIHAYRPDPRMGEWSALDAAHEQLHRRGMRLLLDFVPNHLALDNAWTHEHPEYFIQGTLDDLQHAPAAFFQVVTLSGTQVLAHGKDPYFPPWTDVAQLNLFHPGAREALIHELSDICRHCDGVRCDMAMLVLNETFARVWAGQLKDCRAPRKEFWEEVRAALPDPMLLAEAYWGSEPRLISLGFNFAYDKGFYDALRAGRVEEVRARLFADFRFQSHLAKFLENHDEDRSASAFGPVRWRAAAAIIAAAPGMRFYHQGQLEGRRVHLPIQLSHAADEPVDRGIYDFYHRLLIATNDEIFHSGAWRQLEPESVGDGSSVGLIACDWQNDKGWKLVVANLSDATAQARIHLGDRIAPEHQYVLEDVLNAKRYLRDGNELRTSGLYVRLDAFEADILDISAE